MRETALIMGMPVTVEVVGTLTMAPIAEAFAYFRSVDQRFSTYKPESEISAINRGELADADLSAEMREVFELAEATRVETDGFFDIRRPDGQIDPSGLVKGWAIRNAAEMIRAAGYANFYVEAGGDIQCRGHNAEGQPWRVGIRNPFNDQQIIKVLQPGAAGVATSGTYVRGDHIYDPTGRGDPGAGVVSLTVIAGDIYEADRFATAAFAMGRDGIGFIEATDGLEGYAIDRTGTATMTSGFRNFVSPC